MWPLAQFPFKNLQIFHPAMLRCGYVSRLSPRKLHYVKSQRLTMTTSLPPDIKKLEEVVEFWSTIEKSKKFSKNAELDAIIAHKYSDIHGDLMSGSYDSLLESSPMPGILGAVLVLDQFTRNMFRGTAKAFASDAKSLSLAKQVISSGCHKEAGDDMEWFYLPFMHSEDLSDQNLCVQYFSSSSWGTDFAVKHRDQIEEFGRFPHRNEPLGRTSTPEEIEFMKHNSGF